MSAATVLDQFLDPLSRCLDAESARRVDERRDYEILINAEDFVAIPKLTASPQLSEAM